MVGHLGVVGIERGMNMKFSDMKNRRGIRRFWGRIYPKFIAYIDNGDIVRVVVAIPYDPSETFAEVTQ